MDAIFVFLLPGFLYLVSAGVRPLYAGDIATQFSVYLGRLACAFHSSYFPFWEPLWAGGYPFAADPQTMCYYLPAWLAAVLMPPSRAATVLVFFHLGLGAVGIWWFARGLFEDRIAALLSAIIYSLGGYTAGHLIHLTFIQVVGLFPWLLVVLLPLNRSRTGFRRTAAGGLLFALVFLAGHPQGAMIITGLILYLLGFLGNRRKLLAGLGALFLGLGLSAVGLLSYAELAGKSIRANFTYDSFILGTLHPLQLLAFISPLFFGGGRGFISSSAYWGGFLFHEIVTYVGIIPLILGLGSSILGLSRKNPRRRMVLVFSALVVLGVVLSCSKALGLSGLLFHIPLIQRFRVHARYMFLTYVGMCFLAPTGLLALQGKWEGIEPKKAWNLCLIIATIFLALVYAVAVWGFLAPDHFFSGYHDPDARLGVAQLWDGANRSVRYTSMFIFVFILLFILHKMRRFKMALIFLVLTLLDLGIVRYALLPKIKSPPPAIPGELRQALYGSGWTLVEYPYLLPPELSGLSPNHPLARGDRVLNQYNPLILGNFAKATSMDYLGRVNEPEMVFFNKGLCSALGIRRVVIAEKFTRDGRGDFFFLRRPRPGYELLPRREKTGNFVKRVVYKTFWFGEDEISSPPARVYIPEKIIPGSPEGVFNPKTRFPFHRAEEISIIHTTGFTVVRNNPPARIIRQIWGRNFGELEVEAQKNAVVVFRLIDYPGWRLTVDGEPLPTFPANGCFIAAYARQGRHVYQIRFVPTYFKIGAFISGASLLGSLLFLILPFFLTRKSRVNGNAVTTGRNLD